MPFPLPLLAVTDKDLTALDAHEALRHQNTFMKNALIRGLNNTHKLAGTITLGSHKSYPNFIEYVQVVCEMLHLHVEGDEIFFTKRGPNTTSLDELLGAVWSKNPERKKLREMIKTWTAELKEWDLKPALYQGASLRKRLEQMEVPLLKGSLELVQSIKPEVISKAFDNQQLAAMVNENIEWLVLNSDIAILVPYCIAHHDLASSKHWPVITKEGLEALPALVRQNENKWALAPFDPVKRTARL